MVTGCLPSDGVEGTGRGPGCRAGRPARHPGRRSTAGQLASMLSSVVLASCPPLIHAVISRQNEPEPTSPGIWSDPSNTHSVASFWIVAKVFRRLALVAADVGVASAGSQLRLRLRDRGVQNSVDVRYSMTFWADSLSALKRPAMSPPPSTGLDSAVLPGIGNTPTSVSRFADDLVREEALLGEEVALPVHVAARRVVEHHVACGAEVVRGDRLPATVDLPSASSRSSIWFSTSSDPGRR